MNEWQPLIQAADTYAAKNQTYAIATLVQIEGSSYKGLGARMLIGPSGQTTGVISGGCLEADVAQYGLQVMATGQAQLITYDSRSDEDLIWGLGLGCQGVIRLLVERIHPNQGQEFFGGIKQILQGESHAVLAIAWQELKPQHPKILGTTLISPKPSYLVSRASQPLSDWIQKEALAFWRTQEKTNHSHTKPRLKPHPTSRNATKILLESVTPPPSVLICGGGFDVEPIAQLAAFLGWPATILLAQKTAASQRSWLGSPLIRFCPPNQLASQFKIHTHTIALVMTHHYERDLEYLDVLLKSTARYIGILGPQNRTQRILADLSKRGSIFSSEQKARLFSPVGLDIGGESPQDIALAIFAEIRAVLSNRNGGFLKLRQGPIHHR